MFTSSYDILKEAKIDSSENCKALRDSHDLYLPLHVLYESKLLTQENFTLLTSHADHALYFQDGFYCLYEARLLDQATFENCIHDVKHPKELAEALACLSYDKDFLKTNFVFLRDNDKFSSDLAKILRCLNEAKLFTVENRNRLIANAEECFSYSKLQSGVAVLLKSRLLTQVSYTALVQNSENADELARGWEVLHKRNLLTEPHRKLLVQHASMAETLALWMGLVHETNSLTPDNINTFVKREYAKREEAKKSLQAYWAKRSLFAESTVVLQPEEKSKTPDASPCHSP